MERRIYVGNLIYNTDDCLTQLYDRFQKFGNCADGDFERHGTFAYINLKFDNETQLKNLKRSFNNMKFKGNELRVAEAKPDWQSTLHLRQLQDTKENASKEKQMKKQNLEYKKKLENISMSWEDRTNLIKGRMRNSPRRLNDLRNATFRLDIDGALKVYKCYKTKLWGYERDKTAKDLVSKFVNNQWRNDYDHIVDRLTYQRSIQPVRMRIDARKENQQLEEIDSIEEEKEKVTDVLDNFLNNFDFDKPLNIEEGDDIESPTKNDLHSTQQNGSQKRNPNNNLSNQKTDDYTISAEKDTQPEKEMSSTDTDELDTEFLPSFTNVETGTTKTESNTETLRDLFNPEDGEKAGFKLIPESDDDIDHKKDMEMKKIIDDTIDIPQVQLPISQPPNKERLNLFFPHFDSPFLIGQTQLTKVKSAYDHQKLESWDDEFWENRGPWMKEAKRRRRDVVRHLKKVSNKNRSGVLL